MSSGDPGFPPCPAPETGIAGLRPCRIPGPRKDEGAPGSRLAMTATCSGRRASCADRRRSSSSDLDNVEEGDETLKLELYDREIKGVYPGDTTWRSSLDEYPKATTPELTGRIVDR